MIFRGKNYKTTLLLGAGATRGSLCGISRPIIRPPLNKDFFLIIERFVKCSEGKRYKGCYERINKFIREEMLTAKPTMEEVFSTLFMSKDLPEIFRTGSGRTRREGFRPEIRDFLTLVIAIFRFIQNNLKHKNNVDHYGVLTSRLEQGDTIVTLNYDTLIDNALIKAGWRPEKGYGFPASAKIIYKTTRLNSQKKLENVYLLKPHGSLNWFSIGSVSNIEKALRTRPVSRIEVADTPRIYNLSRDKYIRFFIPPLYTKFFDNDLWRNIWHKTYMALKNSECLTVIGCSLITTDYHLHAILSKALKSRNNKYKQIILVDKNIKVIQKLKSLLRGKSQSGCQTYPSFSDFVEKF